MTNHLTFARNLVKGKIAETLFAQMLRETREFTVLEFGYEKIVPELIAERPEGEKHTLETLRTSPDFAVINHKTREVHLIEVKYLHTLDVGYVLRYARRMSESWNPSYLFVASKEGFYFDEVKKICENNGQISRLKHAQIPDSMQAEYHKILMDFEE